MFSPDGIVRCILFGDLCALNDLQGL